jgi:molybdopterin-containing oxidoreductase family membrane subunit
MPTPTTETGASQTGVLGVFAHVDTSVHAIRELRAKGFQRIATYSPVPLPEFEEALTGHGLPRSPVRLFTLVGALIGTVSGFALTIWSALKWNLITGGKPVVSIPPFVIIAFELTILLGGLCTLLGLLVTARLPRLGRPTRYDPRFSADRFGIEIACEPGEVPAVQEILRRAGAEEIRA